MSSTLLPAVILAAAAIGVAAACTAAYLLLRGRESLRQRGLVVGVFSAGILTGLSLLSMLPDAMEVLESEYDWRAVHVMLLFLSSGGAMFVFDNVIITHEHVPSAAPPPLSSLDAVAEDTGGGGGSSSNDGGGPNAVSSSSTASIDVESVASIELACAPCEPCEPCDDDDERPAEPEEEPQRSSDGGGKSVKSAKSGRQKQRHRGSSSKQAPWWAVSLEPCECCDETGAPTGVATSDMPDGIIIGNHARAQIDPPSALPVCTAGLRLVAALMRQSAWILHAAVDGMVIGAIPRLNLLPPAAFAVLICSLQDALAYAVFLSRRRYTTTKLLGLMLALFGLAFPMGAAFAAILQSGLHGGGHEALAILRVVMAAVFCYVATELAPPHTHSKAANMLYAAVFALGVGAAGAAELFEDAAVGHHE